MSGTYPEKDTAELQTIESLIGPILLTVKATELMKKGLISHVKIKALILQHEDKDLERIPLLVVYKQGGIIFADMPEETLNRFELYGFLKLYVEKWGKVIAESLQGADDDLEEIP